MYAIDARNLKPYVFEVKYSNFSTFFLLTFDLRPKLMKHMNLSQFDSVQSEYRNYLVYLLGINLHKRTHNLCTGAYIFFVNYYIPLLYCYLREVMYK